MRGFIMKAFWTLLLIVFQILSSTAIAAGREKDRVIPLRAGRLTLKPVGKAPPVVSSDVAGLRTRGGRVPLNDADALNQPIRERHVVLEFERRLSEKEYPALEAKGVKILSYLEGNAYTARIDQKSTAKLAEATKDINPCIRYGVIESEHKIAPSLARSRTFSESPQKGTSEPTIVSVELWPDADFEAAKAELGKIGHIEGAHEYTKRLDIALPSEDAVQKLAESNYVKFIGPKKKPLIHNTHVRKNVGAEAVQAAQPGLVGTNVKVAVFDEGHVAKDHPSFRGRLIFDPKGDQGTAYTPRPHATHVAGTIAASGDYDLPPLTASQGKAVLTEDMLPGYGENLSVAEGPAATLK